MAAIEWHLGNESNEQAASPDSLSVQSYLPALQSPLGRKWKEADLAARATHRHAEAALAGHPVVHSGRSLAATCWRGGSTTPLNPGKLPIAAPIAR